MKSYSVHKKVLSAFLAVLMAVTALMPAFTAFAGGVVEQYAIELFYEDGTMVPSTDEETGKNFIQYMKEGETLQLHYQFVDGEMPDNGTIKWYSETPTLVDVDQNGLVKAFDSSKGAVIRSWIDNEVRPIPLVGSVMATVLEKALFNDTIDVDTMDTEEIIEVVEAAFGSDSPLAKWVDSYKGQLVDSLREYLDNINSNIHVTLYASDGETLADDYVQICVQKNEEVYANFLPNGTHITNKSNIETTVAKGTTCQLYAVTTPVRLHMGVVYSVKSSSIFEQGNVVATVDDSGLVTFKNTGTVTIVVSPDTEGFINNLLKYVNWIFQTGATGTIDTKQLADILIKYVGIDMDRNVLAAILDAIFVIKDIAGDTANPVQITATAAQIIANIVLKFVYNDSITFNVVDGVPCTDFNIEGATSVQEGAQIQLSITDVKPVAADTSDITWTSSDESVASVDPKTGVITGRDAGGSLGALSKKDVVITATSAANNVSKSYTVTVTGKTGSDYLSDAEIIGTQEMNIDEEQDLTYKVYPNRVEGSRLLKVTWGLVTDGTDADTYKYVWAGEAYEETVIDEATGEETVIQHEAQDVVTNGIGKIDVNGHYTAAVGGVARVALKAVTGYKLLNTYKEMSSVIVYFDIFNGRPVSGISLNPLDPVKGTLDVSKIEKSVEYVEINGETQCYVTVKRPGGAYLDASGIKVQANVQPDDATNKKVQWYIDDTKLFELKNRDDDANTVDVVAKAAATQAASVHIWCESEDGQIQSDVITLCVTRNYVTDNKITDHNGNKIDDISVINGQTVDAEHRVTFADKLGSGSATCNWYSSDENVVTVQKKGNDNDDAVLTGEDVGTATLYCVSADGGIVDTAKVTVYPDKSYLQEVVAICEDTYIKRTAENKELYKDYNRKLDYAYYVLYDEPMASQDTCDTYAKELLYAFYRLGGYIGVNSVSIVDKNDNDVGDFVSVKVDTTLYKNTSVDLDVQMNPKASMYRSVTWSSSSSSVTVDKNGKCTPASNNACWSVITVTVEDYMGTVHSDSVTVSFAKTLVTGVSVSPDTITGGKVGATETLKVTVTPTGTVGVGKADVQDVIWSSSDEKVATVDNKGVVTFRYGGDCVITATTCDGGYTASCNVNVVTNYDALQAQVNAYKGMNLSSINYYPDTWEALQQAIAQSEEMIAANASTQPEVDAMLEQLVAAYEGLEKYHHINGIDIYLDGEVASDYYQFDLSLLTEGLSYENAKLDLNVRLYPNNADYASVEWSSSTDKIQISEEGVAAPVADSKLIALKNEGYYGQITCTVTDHFGEKWTDTVWVSFAYTPVTGVRLSESAIAGAIGDTRQLTAVLDSASQVLKASIQDVYWESMDESIATVDQNGLVTFVNTGATTVRVVSYDGGHFAECSVSTSGDRNALQEALNKYANTDYRDYEYSYGMEFKTAYEEAQQALNDATKTQAEIDQAAEKLNAAGEALAGHELVKTECINIDWVGYAKNLVGSYQEKTRGTVSADTNALTIDLSKDNYANTLRDNNKVELTASVQPEDADYQSISWSVDSSYQMNSSEEDGKLVLSTNKAANNGWATVTVTVTDHYGRTTARTITVVLSTDVISGVSLDKSESTMLVTDAPLQLNATLNGANNKSFKDITWTTSDETVATVDQNGLVTPVDVGTAVITVKTLDGGYTATCTITVNADYSVITEKYEAYSQLLRESVGQYVYTEESLAVLQDKVNKAGDLINQHRATQAELDAQVQAMDDAFHALVKYIIADGVSITTDTEEQNNVTVVNPGYIRYTATGITTLNNKTIQLDAVTTPDGGLYTDIQWSSSNDNVTVDANGLVTKNNSTSQECAKITCTITTIKGDTYSDSVYVSFTRNGAESVSLDQTTVRGKEGDTVQLKATVNPNSTLSKAIQDCTYTTSDPSVATVDANGVVTFANHGSATITVTSCDGGYTATATAYTTWDFSALDEAIANAKQLDYMDYAYAYGTDFKAALEAAEAVQANYVAEQSEIDAACTRLQTAMETMKDHPFVAPGEITITSGSITVIDGKALEMDANKQVTLSANYNPDAMLKAVQWSTDNVVNATAETDANGNLVITKTSDEETATLAVTVTLTDDYDRTYTKTVNVKVVNQKVNIDRLAFVYEGAETEAVTYDCKGVYTNKSIQLSVNTYPVDADAYTAINWSSNSKNLVVDQTGKVSFSGVATTSSYKADITCTVTLEDGSTVSNTIQVTFNRGSIL